MKRRKFLALSFAATVTPCIAWASQNTLEYTPGLIEEKLGAGNIVMVDFFQNYCSTCRAQARILKQLRGNNSAYDANIVFINVDIKTNSDLAKKHNVTRHGTLLLLSGNNVLARVDSSTSSEKIKAFLDAGLV
jgi:thioredoxin 1